MPLEALSAVNPLDGRYGDKTRDLRGVFSEYGLIRHRVQVEIRWLLAMADAPAIAEVPALPADDRTFLEGLGTDFDLAAARRVKALEATTNHDVKAVEYWLKEQVAPRPSLAAVAEFIHFGCTSEDINNLAHAMALAEGRRVVLTAIDAIEGALTQRAGELADLPMLAHTHGQPASPTTVGKELAVFVHRLRRARQGFGDVPLWGKLNGATGNYSAFVAAYPEVDWPGVCRGFVEGLGFQFNTHTTQIEPHDGIAELFDALSRLNVVLLDFCRDMWGYIAKGYFRQRAVAGEVGSSTMPHKVNPIDFENAEGNLGLANAVLDHLSRKLPISRFQRDLSDSTALRATGTAFGHALVAYQSCLKGIGKLAVNTQALDEELDRHWEVLAEPIQTVMRRHGLEAPYEQLKALTRDHRVDTATLRAFVEGLDLPADAKARLLALTPQDYVGLGAALGQQV
ncbi:MAG: adenylosuccinate lyase [Candidatus Competibacterales bacterium]